PKVPGWTSVRTVTAAQTDAVLARVRARFGVARVAEVTHLDTLGIPCYSAITPGIGISAYSGKSLDREEARVGAQMEALEAALVYDRRVPARRATYEELAGEACALDPERLPIVGSEGRNLRTVAFDWVEGWDLRAGGAVWVPADAAYAPEAAPPWYFSSNGLASGNCMAEALAHALAEVIERDAKTIQAVADEYAHLPALLRLLAGPPRVSPPDGYHEPPVLDYPWIDMGSLPDPLRDGVARIERAGAAVDLRWITSEIEVPVIQCLIHESHGPATMTHAGSGAHPDATVAARRAITEAAQSRATFIHGVREDLSSPALKVQETPCGGWFDARAPRVELATLPSHEFADVGDDLCFMAAALARAGLHEIIAVDLSHPELPFAVVRVIVPELEAPLEFSNRERIALGWRARRYLDSRLERAS
ncbi:MAG: YcaO-like family protein, partial [Dehalococcoidia bacterium]